MKKGPFENEYGDIVDPNGKGPLVSGNCLSQLFFFYGVKPISLGNKKFFEESDLWGMEKFLLYGNNYHKYSKYYRKKDLKKTSLFKIMMGYIMSRWIWAPILIGIANFFQIILPFILRAIISWISDFKNGLNPGKSLVLKFFCLI